MLLSAHPELLDEDTEPESCVKEDAGAYILYVEVEKEDNPVMVEMDNISQYECNVCYEPLSEGVTNCRHRFCMTCALKWTQVNDACPICRDQITSVTIQRLQINSVQVAPQTPVAALEDQAPVEVKPTKKRRTV